MNHVYNELGRTNAELRQAAIDALHRLAMPQSTFDTLSVRHQYPMDPQPIRLGSDLIHTHLVSDIEIFGKKSSDTDFMRGRISEPIEDGSRHTLRGGHPIPYVPHHIRAGKGSFVVTTFTQSPDPEEGPIVINEYGFDTSFQRTTLYNTVSGKVSALGGFTSFEGERLLANKTQFIDVSELPKETESRRLLEILKTAKLAKNILEKVSIDGEVDVTWKIK